MTKEKVTIKINETLDVFGMKADIASKAMNITRNTFYKKVNPKEELHTFNIDNYNNLVTYIKDNAVTLKKIK